MSSKFIVTTTINSPTAALIAYSKMKDWTLIVVGDLATPHEEYSKLNCIYYHPSEQERDWPELSELVGWRSIQRRNFGFLLALRQGAEVIATVDDDNIPLDGWGEGILIGKTVTVPSWSGELVFDPISVTNYPHLWHRGFPIQRLTQRNYECGQETIKVDIQAGFWNGDPDIDAICRMEHGPNCEFDEKCFPFTSTLYSPFNSQNTFLSREALKSYFMLPGVGRMDDIWAAYYLESRGFRVLYSRADVRQDRNVHNLTKDFEGEVIGYLKTDQLLRGLTENSNSFHDFLPEPTKNAFDLYLQIADQI